MSYKHNGFIQIKIFSFDSLQRIYFIITYFIIYNERVTNMVVCPGAGK
jgi:hypothetical protein